MGSVARVLRLTALNIRLPTLLAVWEALANADALVCPTEPCLPGGAATLPRPSALGCLLALGVNPCGFNTLDIIKIETMQVVRLVQLAVVGRIELLLPLYCQLLPG